MKKAVSMPCTAEQFETIKYDLINNDVEISNIISFEQCSFLVNNFLGKLNIVSNVLEADYLNNKRELIPKFDKSKFLDACGIETETVIMGSDLQYFVNETWYDCVVDRKFRLKPKPDFSKEIEALREKAKQSGFSVTVNFEKL